MMPLIRIEVTPARSNTYSAGNPPYSFPSYSPPGE